MFRIDVITPIMWADSPEHWSVKDIVTRVLGEHFGATFYDGLIIRATEMVYSYLCHPNGVHQVIASFESLEEGIQGQVSKELPPDLESKASVTVFVSWWCPSRRAHRSLPIRALYQAEYNKKRLYKLL